MSNVTLTLIKKGKVKLPFLIKVSVIHLAVHSILCRGKSNIDLYD